MKSAEHWHDEGVTNIASTLRELQTERAAREQLEARLKDAELPTLEHVQAIYVIYREKARVESAESALAALKAELKVFRQVRDAAERFVPCAEQVASEHAALKLKLEVASAALEKIATARVRSREDLMHIAKEALSQLNESEEKK